MRPIAIDAMPAKWLRIGYSINFYSRNETSFKVFIPIKKIVRTDFHYIFEPADMEIFLPIKVQPHDMLAYQHFPHDS